MYRLAIATLPLLFIVSQRLSAQVDSSGSKVLRGIIVDDSLAYTLPFVHLWNVSTKTGAISNESGEFNIKVRGRDTIVFSALGYFGDSIIVSDSFLNQMTVVHLKPKKYELAEVVIRRFGSYESFKYQVIHLDLPKTKTDYLRENIKAIARIAAVEADMERAAKDKMNGFGYTTPIGGGISHEKEIMKKISNLKKREQIINEKFNRALVKDITHLEGDELTAFIASCNFSDDYLYETDLYTIVEALYAKLDAYLH